MSSLSVVFSVDVHIYVFTSAESLVTDHLRKPGSEVGSNITDTVYHSVFRSDSVGPVEPSFSARELNWEK